MEFLSVASWPEALQARAAHPTAVPVAGATDVMVGLNQDRLRPAALLDLTRVPELNQWSVRDSVIRIGACVTYTQVIDELSGRLRALAMAARAVGSPQIRHRGTIGGCLGSAAPHGDAHPALLAAEAVVEVASVRGVRLIPTADFYLGPGRTALAADELIAAVLVPVAAGPEWFTKVGGRRAMVVSVATVALRMDAGRRRFGCAFGAATPAPARAGVAEDYLAGELADRGLWDSRVDIPEPVARRFGDLVGATAKPEDDVRATGAYRRRALAVTARRALEAVWLEFQGGNNARDLVRER